MVLRTGRLLIWLAFVGALGVSLGGPLAAQRVCCQGDWWLGWSHDAREKYVLGYITAYTQAYGAACRKMDLEWPGPVKQGYENAPLNKCLAGQPDFSKGTDYFVNATTDFYTRYPHDRDIYPSEVLEQLGKGLSLQQIDKYPFMRHKP